MHSGHLLDCLCPVVLSLQQILERFSSPMNTWVCRSKDSCRCLKKVSFTSWSGHLQRTLMTTLSMLGCYLNAQLGHHPFLGRAPCIPTVFSHKWQLPFLTIPYFINSLSIHCSTPATGASPPHLSDLKETVALYSHTDLQFLLFIPYAACICAWALQRGT